MKDKRLVIIPIVTFFIGFFPSLLMSIHYSVFDSREIVMLPLVYNVSVMFGDSFLLPLINYLLCRIIITIMDVIKANRKLVVIYLCGSIILSLLGNVILHLSWANDFITDFIAFSPGDFSIIGIWHLVFSTLETVVLSFFGLTWFLCVKHQMVSLYNKIHNLWIYIFIFTTLGFFDMLNKYFFVFLEKSFVEVLYIDKFAFFTPIASLLLLFVFKYLEKHYSLKNISST